MTRTATTYYRSYLARGIASETRTVHARSRDGVEVVRYDKQGKWYLEPPGHLRLPRQHVKIDEAVRFARWAEDNGGEVFLGHFGGGTFDRKIKEQR